MCIKSFTFLFPTFCTLSFAKWNFTKFIVDKSGQPVKRYGPITEPFVSSDTYFSTVTRAQFLVMFRGMF